MVLEHLYILLYFTPKWRFIALLFGGLVAYFLIAGACYVWLNRFKKRSWSHLKFSIEAWSRSQIKFELKASTVSPEQVYNLKV